ncbi:MAG: sugar-binding domain-containing protein [Armatimonadota bacterium]
MTDKVHVDKQLLSSDFKNTATGWTPEPFGEWSVKNGVYEGINRSSWAGDKNWTDYRLTFEARMIDKGEDGQIWVSFRYHDEWNRYTLALRDSQLNDLFLCRYRRTDHTKPDLEIENCYRLGFEPEVNKWYTFKIEVRGNRIQAWVGSVDKPQVDYLDRSPITNGAIALGGSWHRNQFRNVLVEALEPVTEDYVKSNAYESTLKQIDEQTEKEIRRKEQRASYKAIDIPSSKGNVHPSTSLNGNWLFMPDYQLNENMNPENPLIDDNDWHTLNVPDFWNQVSNWLYGGNPKEVSESFRHQETERVNAYTFDSAKTNAGWYRHWINLPSDAKGKRLVVRFGASASITEVFFNGHRVGEHVGMFAPFTFDLALYANWGGKNLLAVHVIGHDNKKTDDQVKGLAVSVEVTGNMLNSLPQGIYAPGNDNLAKRVTVRQGGIWQGVTLEITDPVHISDLFFQPHLDGAKLDVEIRNTDGARFTGELCASVAGAKVNSAVSVEAGKTANITLDIPVSNPKLWTPEHPNLYLLKVELKKSSNLIDKQELKVGFRTFEVRNGKFYLNDRPYFIRGANMPPHSLKPNDADLAHRFLKLMHDGNQLATRTHGSPFPSLWVDAADEEGVMVSLEGTWPWLMLYDQPIPDKQLINIWRQETFDIIKNLRNHPSITIWTVNNEMHFFPDRFEYNDVKHQKWQIVSDIVRDIRRLDPTRPVCMDSGYAPTQKITDYVKANNFDDGDICDPHLYLGYQSSSVWSNISYNGKYLDLVYGDKMLTPHGMANMPQEASTGYPNNDTGHFVRSYLSNYTPQAWVGDDAYDHRDPAYFLWYHKVITKEWIEDVRRSRNAAGWMSFSNICWFQNVHDPENIKPWPVYDGVKKALSDVLVSLDQRNRHYFAGSMVDGIIHVVNDASNGKDLRKLSCVITMESKEGVELLRHMVSVPDCPYYASVMVPVQFRIPTVLQYDRGNYKLVLKLFSGNRQISENDYDLLIATHEWSSPNTIVNGRVLMMGNKTAILKIIMESGIPLVDSIDNLQSGDTVIWVGEAPPDRDSDQGRKLLEHVRSGGKLMLLETGQADKLLPEGMIQKTWDNMAEFANQVVPDHPVFAGLTSQDLRWWNGTGGQSPQVCATTYELEPDAPVVRLARVINPVGYVYKHAWRYPAFILSEGKGEIMVSELRTSACTVDPIAAKVMNNILRWSGVLKDQ